MRILLIKPHYRYSVEIAPPLGLGYLAAMAQREGHEVRILDNRLAQQGERTTRQTLHSWRPDMLGISAVFHEYEMARQVAQTARTILPDINLVVGGPLATADPALATLDGLSDYAVIGEGESVFMEIISRLDAGRDAHDVRGIVFRNADGTVTINPPAIPIEDLDALPYPAWDLMDIQTYFRVTRMGLVYKKWHYWPIFTSRGCPYQCIYCHNVFGKVFRGRSSYNVVDEMEMLKQRYDIREIHVLDDIFNANRERASAILQEIIDRRLNMALCFNGGLRGDIIDQEFVDLMYRAGTYRVSVAIESGSPRIQRVISKNVDLERVRQSIEMMARKRILTNAFVMFGFPTETEEEAKETIKFTCRTKAHSASFFFINCFPGTKLAELVKEHYRKKGELPKPTNYFDPQAANLEISEIPPTKLRSLVRSAWWRFYVLSPWRLWRIFRDFPSKHSLFYVAWVVLVRALTLAPWVAPINWRRATKKMDEYYRADV